MACVSEPQQLIEEEAEDIGTELSDNADNGSGFGSDLGGDSYAGDLDPIGGDEYFKVSFPGLPFSGGAVRGEGISCNRTSDFDCEKTYPAGSNLLFEIPVSIVADGQSLQFAGRVVCNGVEANLAATAPMVQFRVENLGSDQECSFYFQ